MKHISKEVDKGEEVVGMQFTMGERTSSSWLSVVTVYQTKAQAKLGLPCSSDLQAF